MAGHGPAPKDPDSRVRRSTPERGDWINLPAKPYRGEKAHLPRVAGGLLQSTKDAWKTWWSSPMAHMWNTVDWPQLRMAIALLDDITRMQNSHETKGLTSLIKEYRLIIDDLGLSEKGRRNLRWRLPGEETEQAPAGLASVTEISSRTRPDPRTA